MTFAILPAKPGLWLDCDGLPSGPECAQLAAQGYVGLFLYLPFAGLGNTSTCVTLQAIKNAHAAGLQVSFVQHVRGTADTNYHWDVSAHSGAADGLAAGMWLRSIDQVLCDASIFQDIEAVTGTAAQTIVFCQQFGNNVANPGLYAGFDNPMTADDMWELPRVKVYWSDAGHRKVSHRGCLVSQGRTVTIGGRQYDIDSVRAVDDLGENHLLVAAPAPADVG